MVVLPSAPLSNNASKLTVQQPELPPEAGDADSDVARSLTNYVLDMYISVV